MSIFISVHLLPCPCSLFETKNLSLFSKRAFSWQTPPRCARHNAFVPTSTRSNVSTYSSPPVSNSKPIRELACRNLASQPSKPIHHAPKSAIEAPNFLAPYRRHELLALPRFCPARPLAPSCRNVDGCCLCCLRFTCSCMGRRRDVSRWWGFVSLARPSCELC